MRNLLLLLVGLLLTGCSNSAPQMSAPVAVSGKVSAAGAPVSGCVLMLQPLEDGHPAPCTLGPDGTFQANLVPGKYAYFVQKGSDATATDLSKLNAKFLEADLGRTVTVAAGQTSLDIALD
jgi:hypothetical protein